MKITFITFAIIATVITQHSFAQDSARQQALPQLLSHYLAIKSALVAGNTANAATGAASFLKVANSIDYKIISEGNINMLVKDAGRISEATDINKQRGYFANLSSNMAAVAKSVKLTDKPLYYDYCPMKKTYWLSSEKDIKNPYYGNSMLTCGEISEIIQ